MENKTSRFSRRTTALFWLALVAIWNWCSHLFRDDRVAICYCNFRFSPFAVYRRLCRSGKYQLAMHAGYVEPK